MRKIVAIPNLILSKPTKPVTRFDESLRKVVREMEEILKKQHDPEGVGLSANQIGKNLSVALVRLNPDEQDGIPRLLTIVNPEIVKHAKESTVEYEGCLSLLDQYGLVERANTVTVKFQNLSGKKLTLNATDFLARIFQHEIDHLNGKTIAEKVKGGFLSGEELEKLFQKENGQK